MLTAPALLALFVVLVDIAQLWVARIELANALEAAALAAVKEWGDADGGSTQRPRQVGAEYAAANTVIGVPVVLDLNFDENAEPNENAGCSGSLVFGAVLGTAPPYVFDADADPQDHAYGVRTQAAVPVASLWSELFGISFGTRTVSATATARYAAAARRPQLVHVEAVECEDP